MYILIVPAISTIVDNKSSEKEGHVIGSLCLVMYQVLEEV